MLSPQKRPLPRSRPRLEDLELALLLEGIERCYGFDFRPYAPQPLRRRVHDALRAEGARTLSGLQEALLHDASAFARFVTRISVNVTSLFREPSFYRSLRSHVAPVIRDRQRPRVWLMGCATGEELYATAVTLREEGLEQAQIYATDIHEAPLERAAAGWFPLHKLRSAELGYRAGGGRRSLGEYYDVRGDRGVFKDALRANVVFASHNFVTDATFNQFDVIVSRGVLSALGSGLQGRVHRLFYDSLPRAGFLALGRGEGLSGTPLQPRYEPIDASNGVFRKCR